MTKKSRIEYEAEAAGLRIVNVDEYETKEVYDEQKETAQFYNKSLANKQFYDFCEEFATPDENGKKKRFYGVIKEIFVLPIRTKTGETTEIIGGKMTTPFNNWTLNFRIWPAELQHKLKKELFKTEDVNDKDGVCISRKLVVTTEIVQELVDYAFNCEVVKNGVWHNAQIIEQR